MIITALEAVQMLAGIAETAQTSGLVRGGTPALVLAGIAAALQLTLKSGALAPGAPLEIDEIGIDFAAAMQRQLAAMAQKAQP